MFRKVLLEWGLMFNRRTKNNSKKKGRGVLDKKWVKKK